jgi:hypothetical protein
MKGLAPNRFNPFQILEEGLHDFQPERSNPAAIVAGLSTNDLARFGA